MTTPRPIVLTPEERAECRRILDAPDATPYKRHRALILLLAERRPGERGASNDLIARLTGVNRRTVTRVRSAFARSGVAGTLQGQPSARLVTRKLSRDQELRLFSLLETTPPPGHSRWTVRTLSAAASDLEGMPEISRELVRRLLKRSPTQTGSEEPERRPMDSTVS